MKSGLIKNKIYFYSGIVIALIIISSYFIKVTTDSGFNFVERESLLGILILHNPFILAGYILASTVLIFKGTRR